MYHWDQVFLRTAIDVGAEGWANFDYVQMPDYRWGIFLSDAEPDRRIGFGYHVGQPVWQEVPGEHRAALRRLIVTQADTEPASVEQQRRLGAICPSLYDLRNLFQVKVEEGRHLWAMVYLLHSHFGKDGRDEADELLARRAGSADKPRILGAFNAPVEDWVDFFMFTMFTDRDGKYQLLSLAESAFDPLSRSCRFMLTEEAHHLFVGETGVDRIVRRSAELTRLDPNGDAAAQGGIPLPLIQKFINLWCTLYLELFGGEVSSNAATYFAAGLKGRAHERRYAVPRRDRRARPRRVVPLRPLAARRAGRRTARAPAAAPVPLHGARAVRSDARRATQLVFWELDLVKDRILYDATMLQLLGLDYGEDPASSGALMEMVHPDHRTALIERFQEAMQPGDPVFSFEHQIINKSGQCIWLQTRGRVAQRDAAGRVVLAVGTAMNISERKQAEAALLRRSEQLAMMSTASQSLNSELDIPVILRQLVAAALQITGATAGAAARVCEQQMVFNEYNQGGRLLPIAYRFPPGYGVPGRVLQTRKFHLSNDAVHDPYVVPEIQHPRPAPHLQEQAGTSSTTKGRVIARTRPSSPTRSLRHG